MTDIYKVLQDIHRREEDTEPEDEDLEGLDELEEQEFVAPPRPSRAPKLRHGWDRDDDGDPTELDFN